MTLLEEIIKASTNPEAITEPLKYPENIDADPLIQNLKPASENPDPFSLVQPLDGFLISDPDSGFTNSGAQFCTKLKLMLKNPKSFSDESEPFIDMLNSFLEEIVKKRFGEVGLGLTSDDCGAYYCDKLLEKYGFLVGRDVMSLVIEGLVLLEQWQLLETLIVNKLVDYGLRSDLLYNLVAKRREEWENEALLAIKKATDQSLSGKTLELAKDASILLMMAYDSYSLPELCLHFLVSCNVDDVVFSSAVSKLNAEEMMALIRYLGKWLRKYERFPQAVPCPTAEAALGLKMCKWVPKLEDVVKCLGLVVDEHFFSLALRSEVHREVKEIEGFVGSLVSEGRLCCSLANVIEVLKPEVGGA
ncbi:hypothetical protein Cgig2_006158 [Carnegiea gigantea]|uniref:Uncharacterized protein n=1 Tax=Carnegiea gigantea TaxID=171969 RepID=A0A9Q1QR80_9CARY|nr:hypothetical protein Cgig2_006158 [Carnegiea gigantea]